MANRLSRNIDIHGPKVSPSQTSSRVAGLEMRYAMNAQMIKFWRVHLDASRLLYREYQNSRAYPECCKVLKQGQEWAENQLVELRAVQVALQSEIDYLQGQLPLPLRGQDEV